MLRLIKYQTFPCPADDGKFYTHAGADLQSVPRAISNSNYFATARILSRGEYYYNY